MALRLYGTARSPYAARCRMLIYVKNLDIEIVDVEAVMTKEERRRFNPACKAPFLVTDKRVILESDVICEYLEETHSSPSLLPTSPEERAFVRSLARFSDEYILKRALSLLRFVKQNDPDPGEIEADLANLRQGLRWVEKLIPEGRHYLVGDDPSLADLIAVPALFGVITYCRILAVPSEIDVLDRISRYWSFIQSDEAASAVIKEMTLALQPYFPILREDSVLDGTRLTRATASEKRQPDDK